MTKKIVTTSQIKYPELITMEKFTTTDDLPVADGSLFQSFNQFERNNFGKALAFSISSIITLTYEYDSEGLMHRIYCSSTGSAINGEDSILTYEGFDSVNSIKYFFTAIIPRKAETSIFFGKTWTEADSAGFFYSKAIGDKPIPTSRLMVKSIKTTYLENIDG